MHRNIIKIILIQVFGLAVSFGSIPYSVGDFVENFTDSTCSVEGQWSLYDYYGAVNNGENHVVWLIFFNASARRCQLEAAYTQTIYQLYKNQGLVALGVGAEWTEESNCINWAKAYGIKYPIVDDSRSNIRSLFMESSVPYHVIIDHNMQIVYSDKGSIIPPHNTEFLNALSGAIQNMQVLSTNDFNLPETITLSTCFPNPFNSSTNISYFLNQESMVSVRIIDMLGYEKEILIKNLIQPSGKYLLSWNADQLSSGIYFIELVTPNTTQHQKVLLVK